MLTKATLLALPKTLVLPILAMTFLINMRFFLPSRQLLTLCLRSQYWLVFQDNKIQRYSVVTQITTVFKMFSVCLALLVNIFEESNWSQKTRAEIIIKNNWNSLIWWNVTIRILCTVYDTFTSIKRLTQLNVAVIVTR